MQSGSTYLTGASARHTRRLDLPSGEDNGPARRIRHRRDTRSQPIRTNPSRGHSCLHYAAAPKRLTYPKPRGQISVDFPSRTLRATRPQILSGAVESGDPAHNVACEIPAAPDRHPVCQGCTTAPSGTRGLEPTNFLLVYRAVEGGEKTSVRPSRNASHQEGCRLSCPGGCSVFKERIAPRHFRPARYVHQ